MSDESRGTREKEKLGEDTVEDPGLIPGEGTEENVMELDDFSQDDSGKDVQPGLRRSPISIEVHVVQTTSDPADPVSGSSESLQTERCDSDYSSMKSIPGYEETLSELDRSSLEKTTSVSPLNFSASYSKSEDPAREGSDFTKADLKAKPKANNSARGPALRTHGGWDGEADRRSNQSRRTVKEGVCCCYQTVHRGCLQCVEETPAMLPGLVLSLAFCVTIIVLIPTTGRVRYPLTPPTLCNH